MDTSTGNSTRERSKPSRVKSRKLRYLYLNDELHRVLHINRSTDTVIMWCYPQSKRVAYTYSDVKARMQRAFTSAEVTEMLQRNWAILWRAIKAGDIETPQSTLGEPGHNRRRYFWSEKDIMAMHKVLSERHRGRPRRDGLIIPQAMPSENELRAMIRHDAILYVKTEDGEFVPTWQAEHF